LTARRAQRCVEKVERLVAKMRLDLEEHA
jgi:hypothetical protein